MTRPRVAVVPMDAAHWPRVREIYEAGIASGDATFQTEAPAWEAWDAGHLPSCRLVAVDDGGRVVGWAALSPTSTRAVYAGVCEVSIYVALHLRAGFRVVGRRERIGCMHGRWRNVLLLERRSAVVGAS